ncbi:MAG: amino acid adenylation domain-containing protein, partial [Pseudomonadota bacterium]
QQHDVTLFMFLQTAFAVLLGRYSNEKDIVIGTPIAGRSHKELEPLIGLFLNTLILRTKFENNPSFNELLKSNKKNILNAFDHQYIPFEMLVDELQPERSLSHNPLLQIMFVLHNNESVDLSLTDVSLSAIEQTNFSIKYDLALHVTEHNDQLMVCWTYDKDLLSADSVQGMASAFSSMLAHLMKHPDTTIETIPLVNNANKQEILYQWNSTRANYPDTLCIHELIETSASRFPDACAIYYEGEQLSYQQLNEQANQLAHYLINNDVKPNTMIALFVEPTLEMMIGILAILKSGGAYLPINPDTPESRIHYILEHACVEIVITQNHLLTELDFGGRKIIPLDNQIRNLLTKDYSKENPDKEDLGLNNKDLAYIIYTSGSTGQPKGVQLSHDGLVNLVSDQIDRLELTNKSKMLQFSSISFDAAIWEWSCILSAGGCLVQGKDTKEPSQFFELLNETKFTHALLPPSFLIATEDRLHELVAMQCLVIGADTCPMSIVKKLPEGLKLFNAYGPTESTVIVSMYEYVSGNKMLIGKPINNTNLYVLNDSHSICPPGVVGELYIGGKGLAKSYLNQEELTKKAFIELSIDDKPLQKFYKSGDKVRWTKSGLIEFIGRVDNQVKVRGFRVDLGEIETHLSNFAGLKSSVVSISKNPNNDNQLVAYIVSNDELHGSDGSIEQSKRNELINDCSNWLRTRVPEYMVPSIFVVMEKLPQTLTGKVDRKALPTPSEADLLLEKFAAPESEQEQLLCNIWQELLRIERIGIQDNFFSLGGDSIISIQVVSRAKKHGMNFTVRQLFENQTIQELMPHITFGEEKNIDQTESEGEMPLMPIQEEFFLNKIPDQHHFNQSVLLTTPEKFEFSFVQPMIKAIVVRHDAFRLRFKKSSKWSAKFHDIESIIQSNSIEVFDLSEMKISLQVETLEKHCQQIQEALNIEAGPLFKVIYFNCGKHQGRLFIVVHHLIIDTVSWRILLEDLKTAYQCLREHKPIALAPKTTSYQQWSLVSKEYASSSTVMGEYDYWIKQLSSNIYLNKETGDTIPSKQKVTINKLETDYLLGECHQAFRTNINELLLSALLLAYCKCTDRVSMRLNMEGHGREDLFENLDVTETIGWFTTIYPLMLKIEENSSIEEAILLVKEQIRSVPAKGYHFGLLKHTQGMEKLAQLDEAQKTSSIVFNYLGQFDNSFDSSAEFSFAPESGGNNHSHKQHQREMLSINGMVAGEVMTFMFRFRENIPQLSSLPDAFIKSIQDVISVCQERQNDMELFERGEAVFSMPHNEIDMEGIEL